MNASERSEAEIQKMQELEQAELQKACEIGRELERMEHEPCEDEYIKVPKKALKYRTAGMVAYNVEWLKKHFDIERTVICGAQEPRKGYWIRVGRQVRYIKCEVLDKIRAEIEKAVWEDVIDSFDGTGEVRIPRLDPDDVFEIIDKYKAESEGKE